MSKSLLQFHLLSLSYDHQLICANHQSIMQRYMYLYPCNSFADGIMAR